MKAERNIPALKVVRPKKRGNRRLITLLIIFCIIIFTYLFFQSPLGKITIIEIKGNELADRSQIADAAGVASGDSFFTVKSDAVSKRVHTLTMIESVKVTKKFPGVLTIEVSEYSKAAYRLGLTGQPEVILANGTAYPLKDQVFPSDRPLLTGWNREDEQWAALCQVLAEIPEGYLTDISEIKPYPNVYEDRIMLYTRSRFEVITRISLLPVKIPNLSYYTSEFKKKNGTTGILWLLEQDRGVPFADETSGGSS